MDPKEQAQKDKLNKIVKSIIPHIGWCCNLCMGTPSDRHSESLYICPSCKIRGIGDKKCELCGGKMEILLQDMCPLCEEGELTQGNVVECPFCLTNFIETRIKKHIFRYHPGAYQ